MRTYNKQIATAIPLNTNVNSVASPLKNIFGYSVAAIITGTPAGNIKLQASNDPETDDSRPSGVPFPAPTHWVDIKDSTFVLSAAGETMWNVSEVGYNYVRVVYTDTSGGSSNALMTIIVNCKGT